MKTENQNILVLSAGRRVELVQSFIEQRNTLLPSSRVIAVDLRPELSSACQVADQCFTFPRATDPNYSNHLLEFCAKQKIGLVVPTIDTELVVLAELKSALATNGTTAVISGLPFVKLCRDKRQSGLLFNQIGFRYPEIYTQDHTVFPMFVKPLDGSSSKDSQLVKSAEELVAVNTKEKRLMFMEYIGKPYQEFTIDCYFNCSGLLLCAVPRLRIETRAGEVSKGYTRKHGLYDQLWAKLGAWKDARGCITVQVFYDETADDVVGLEINPRFGGGYPLTYAAGGNYSGWLIQEYLLGQTLQIYSNWEDKLLMLRYDSKVLVHDAQY
jgi:carbamoyl-phosphate synthase large subunit